MMKFMILPAACVFALAGCGQHTAATQKLDEKSVKVGIMATQWPKAVTTNTDFVVAVKVTNAGDIVIPSLGKSGDLFKVGITYHWRSADDKVVVWDGIVTSLKADLGKNEEQRIDMKAKAPVVPGTYILELDVVQSGAFWFAGVGSQTARMIINVKSALSASAS